MQCRRDEKLITEVDSSENMINTQGRINRTNLFSREVSAGMINISIWYIITGIATMIPPMKETRIDTEKPSVSLL
jgi:hypothetical protein